MALTTQTEQHWRMWLLGMLSTETGSALTTLYDAYATDTPLGRLLRSTVSDLVFMNDETKAHHALASLVRAFRRSECEACAE